MVYLYQIKRVHAQKALHKKLMVVYIQKIRIYFVL